MKKVIRLTESDLVRLVKRVINEQNNDPKNIETSDNEDWKSKLESYESEMDDFLRQLKDSGTEIDKERFLKKVQKETDAMYWEVYDNSDSEPEGFAELQLNLMKRFRQKLNESDLDRIVKRVIKENDDQSIIKEKIDSLKKTENKYYNIDNDNVELVAKKFGKLLAVSKEFFYPEKSIYKIDETDKDNFREIWNNITNDKVENVEIVEFDY